MWEIELPWPPTLNTHKTIARGRFILSKKGRDYIKACRYAVNSMYAKKLSSNLEITVELFPPDGRNRDIDNYLKALFDAMTDCKVWIDDSQIKIMHVYMKEKTKGGKVILTIGEIK